MRLEEFNKGRSGRLVQMLHGEAAYPAFVPNPLPPEIPLSLGLWRLLSEADRALGELAGLGRQVPNPQLLMRPFVNREAVLSSRIEGTQAGIADLYAYEARQRSFPDAEAGAADADVQEVSNYVHALDYGLQRIQSLPVSRRLLREMHERLMTGVRGQHATPGEFRRSQNWIGPPGSTLSDAAYVPPPTDEMEHALDALERYLHERNSYPPLVRLAFIHYQFEAIHPFLDGNGRIGRLLISLLLVHWNLLPAPLLYLSAYFEKRRGEYYSLLLAVSERGAWLEWTEFFLAGVAEQARDGVERARRLQELQARWRTLLQKARVSALTLAAADSLFELPIVSSESLRKRFEVTPAQHARSSDS